MRDRAISGVSHRTYYHTWWAQTGNEFEVRGGSEDEEYGAKMEGREGEMGSRRYIDVEGKSST